MLFPSPFSMSWSFPIFSSASVSLDFFRVFSLRLEYLHISLDSLFVTVGEFQTWDWLWYLLTCGSRGGVGVSMEQKSWSKCLPWLGVEPRTSHLGVQYATARETFIGGNCCFTQAHSSVLCFNGLAPLIRTQMEQQSQTYMYTPCCLAYKSNS